PLIAAAARLHGESLPLSKEPLTIRLPDYGADIRAFNDTMDAPVEWTKYVVNAGMGEGRAARERQGGWLAKNWVLMDYMDRSGDYVSHRWLKHRGIWQEIYGSNEYQETIHFHEEGARALFWDNGIARDMTGKRTLSQHYNMSVPSWAKRVGWNAFIVCNNAPRWSSVIGYDLVTSPLLGSSTSQDNIGGPLTRIGAGSHGRYCDWCNLKFFNHLERTNRLPDFRKNYQHIRDYVSAKHMVLFRQLPPHSHKDRFSENEAERIARICRDPVMAEYQKFLFLSHMHNIVRYYRNQKAVAGRLGKQYSFHGNQGGGFMGPNAYQIALSDFVDTVWFESAGLSTYDIFKYDWNNAWGAFRFEIGRAMLRGRKPLMCMTKFHKLEPDLVEHEMAEPCAGGGVLFVAQHRFAKQPEMMSLVDRYFSFRHEHRAIFANHGKRRYCQVGLLYSVPTMMYRNYMAAVASPPISAMSGMARALEEGHIPFDVVIFNHPEIHSDFISLEGLKRYRLIILPEIECLSDEQIQKVGDYLDGGGTVGVIGKVGIRDENNRPRPDWQESVLGAWQARGKVVDLTPTPTFGRNRDEESDQTRATTRSAIALAKKALEGEMIMEGALSKMLWVKPWLHDFGAVSLHFVNYDIDFKTGRAAPTPATEISVRIPGDLPVEGAAFMSPGISSAPLMIGQEEGRVSFTLPSVRVYGVVVLGKRDLDRRASDLAIGDALLARARFTCDGNWRASSEEADRILKAKPEDDAGADVALAYANAARKLIERTSASAEKAYLTGVKAMGDIKGATLALDFGGKQPRKGWEIVSPDTAFGEGKTFGWLPVKDASQPTPEESHYAMASRFKQKAPRSLQEGSAIFWPYPVRPPAPVGRSLYCGAPRSFRLVLKNGLYGVRVVTMNPSWILR
ncbi:MAG: hypothetical protein QF473_34785, partial [Planctomycetota bacterium]|nr:hypothetical protein [Planctomycetota bacterium]